MAGMKGYRRSIVLGFDYKEVKQGVPEVNRQMALLNAEYRKSQAEIGKAGSGFDKLKLSQERLVAVSKLQADKVGILKKELETITNSEGNNQKAIERKNIALANAETQYMRTTEQLGRVNKELEAQSTGLNSVKSKWTDLIEQTRASNPEFDKAAASLAKTTGAVVAIGTGAAVASMSFDKEFSKILTIFDTTQVSSVELKKGILDMSRSVNIGAGELASGMLKVASSNIEAKDSLDLLEDSARLAKAGNTDLSSSVSVLTGMINSYGLEVGKSSELSDKLIVTQKLGNLELGELGEGFGRVASLASSANVPLEETLAVLATLTTSGMNTSEAITVLRSMLSNIIKPTGDVADKAKELGINFSLAGLQSKGFARFMEDVVKKSKGSEEALTQLFGSINATGGALTLTGNGAELFAKALEEIGKAGGETDEAVRRISEGSSEKFSSAVNQMKVTMIELGEAMIPVIEFVSLIITGMSKISPAIYIAAGVGMVLYKTFTLLSMILPVVAGMSTLAAGALGTLGVAGAISGGQMMLVAAAVGLIVGLIAVLVGKTRQAKQEIADLGNVTQNSLDLAIGQAQSAVSNTRKKGYAIGTNYASEGWATVGENGPERMFVPKGSKIYDAGTTKYMEQQEASSIRERQALSDAKLDAVVNRLDKLIDTVNQHPNKLQAIQRMGVARG